MAPQTHTKGIPKVVVLGGGFAGLESAYYLKWRLKNKVDITIVSDRPNFLFKPNTIYIPFGMEPEKLMFPLDKTAAKAGVKFKLARAEEIDPTSKIVRTSEGDISYDFLVVATGAKMRPEEIPGMQENAQTIFTPAEMLKLRAAYNALLENAKAGQQQTVRFLVPPNNKCSGPLYEMVFMLDTWLRRNKVRDRVAINYATFEKGYIQAFGPRLNVHVEEEFAKRGIHGDKEHVIASIAADHARFTNGAELPHDLLVSFPPYAAATPFAGLPMDDRGFIATEMASRQVVGFPDIYAAGDTGDFPVKQAFLAFLQGDAVAESLASRILGNKAAIGFEPMSMCVMEQLDRATFAQVPLRLTGNPALPVEVPQEAYGDYKMGNSSIWRLGKKMLGFYLPWRFRNGKPFHAGLPWKGMELGLKAMSGVLAG